MSFVRRSLSADSARLGEKLRALRRSQMLTLPMVAQRTRVQERYLRALEDGDYGALPAPLYTRNFVRAYVRSLQADEQYFLELFDLEVGQSDLLQPHRLPRERVSRSSFFAVERWGRFGSTLLLFLIAISFFAWQTVRVLRPPIVHFSDLQDSVVSSPRYVVEGSVDDLEVTLTINGVLVPLTHDGSFRQEIVLSEGPNRVEIRAMRRFSFSTRHDYVLVYQPVEDVRH